MDLLKVGHDNYFSKVDNTKPNPVVDSLIGGIARRDATSENGIGYNFNSLGDLTKYTDVGLQIGVGLLKDQQRGLLPKTLSDAQSTFSKFKNSLYQTIGSEIVLGTAKGISDLFDFIGQGIGASDHNYSNPVSEELEKAQQAFREWAPIYADPDKDISSGGLTSAGWWAENIPSIASSLTLLIPSTGVTKGLSYLGKGTKLGAVTRTAVKAASKATGSSKVYNALNSAKAIKLGNKAVELGVNAALQRTMENYQEARSVYTDMYDEAKTHFDNMSDKDYQNWVSSRKDDLIGVDVNDKDAVAKHIARTAADEDFKNNYANIVFDVIELYALRNSLGSGQLANIGRKSVNKAQREALRYAGKTAEEIAEIKAKRGFVGKVSDFTKDAILGSKVAIAGQLSEGVEEGINYISQEDAMNTGRVLLGTSNGSTFDTRLKSYLNSPQLWESAFWGVLGGIVFQEAGSRLNRISNNLKNKNKNDEVDPVTGEAKINPEWSLNDELPEVQRRIAEVKGREGKLQFLSQKLDLLRQGKDPDNVNSQEKLSEQEIKIKHQNLVDEAIVDMALTAMNNGNTKMLQEYFANENVRNALVQQGIVEDSDSKTFQQHVIDTIKEIEDKYNEDLVKLTDLSADIKTDNGQVLPYEVLQMIATDNVKYRLASQNLDTGKQVHLQEYERLVADAKANGKLNPNRDYKSALEVQSTIWALSDLYKEREQVMHANRKNPSIGASLALDKINTQINRLQSELYDKENALSLDKLIFTMTQLSQVRKGLLQTDKDGNIIDKSSLKEIEATDKAIKQALDKNDFSAINDIFGLKESKTTMSAEDYEEFKAKHKDLRRNTVQVLNELKKLGDKNNAIVNAYNEAYYYGFQEAIAKANITSTVEELQSNVRIINNTLSEMRAIKLQEASKVFEELLEKYGRNTVEAGMESSRIDDPIMFDNATREYSEEDKNRFNEALKVVNFANIQNQGLYQRFAQILNLKEILLMQQKEKQKKNTTTNQNHTETTENQKSNNISENELEANSEQKTNEIESQTELEPSLQNQNDQSTNPQVETVGVTKDGNITFDESSSESNINIIRNEDGTIELNLKGKKAPAAIRNNKKLFDIEEDASVIDNNAIVIENPIISISDDGDINTIKKGIIGKNDNRVEVTDSPPVKEMEDSNTSTIANSDTDSTNDNDNTTTTNVNTQLNSSTGGLQSNSQVEVSDDGVVISDASILNDPYLKMNDDVIALIKQANLDKTKITMDDIAKTLYDKYIELGIEEEVIVSNINKIRKTPIFNKAISKTNSKIDAILGVYDSNRNSAIDEAESAASKKLKFTKEYQASADRLIKEFLKDRDGIIRTDSNGNEKVYFSFQELLQWANEISQTPEAASSIYYYLKEYINSRSNDDTYKYRIIDKEALNSTQLFDNKKHLIVDNIESSRHRLNIKELIDIYQKSNDDVKLNELLDTLDNAQLGESLDYVVKDNRVVLSIKNKSKSIIIGTLPVPHVSETKLDTYIMANDRWIYDINQNDAESGLKDLFKSWIREDTEAGKELNDIIYSIAYEKDLTDGQLDVLVDRFRRNSEIQKAIKNGHLNIKEDIDYYKAAKGLAKLYKYISKSQVKLRGSEIEYKIKDVLEDSIDDFFYKLLDSYKAIETLSKDDTKVQFKVTLDSVSSGKLSKAIDAESDYLNPEAEEKAIAVKDAVVDLDIFEFGFIPLGQDSYGERTSGIIYGTNGTKLEYPGTPGNTFGIVKDKQGRPHLVRAYPIKFGDSRLSSTINDIKKDILKELDVRLTDFTENKPNALENLREYLNNIFNNKDRSVGRGLLDSRIQISDMGKYRFAISIPGTNNSIIVSRYYSRETGNVNQFSIKDDSIGFDQKAPFVEAKNVKDQALKAITKFIEDSAIGINFNALHHTINAKYPLTGFMSTNEQGDFIITIPNSKTDKPTVYTFNDYKSFLIDNNLVKVNLKKTKDINGKDTNFERRNKDTQIGNQAAYIRIENRNADEIKEIEDISKTTSNVDEGSRRVEQVISVLESTDKRKHKGNEIGRIVLGNSVKNLLKPIQGYSLLPKNIIFDSSLNKKDGWEHVNAVFNVATGDITVGTKWLEMLRNPATKEQAVRKLIHEQLHYILSKDGNSKYIDQIKEIYDDFVQANKDAGLEDRQGIRKYEKLHSNERINLEEFLVESLTSKELIDRLNQIDAKNNIESNKKKSLFQKLINVLSKLFGWDVRKGSLYEKEVRILADIVSPKKETLEQNKEVVEEAESEVVETVKEETKEVAEDNLDDEFNIDIDFDSFRQSAKDEDVEVTSVKSFIESLPLDNREAIRKLIDDGDLSTRCR